MCELPLDSTGLTKRTGAELTREQFDKEWMKNGGYEYLKKIYPHISSLYIQQKMKQNATGPT